VLRGGTEKKPALIDTGHLDGKAKTQTPTWGGASERGYVSKISEGESTEREKNGALGERKLCGREAEKGRHFPRNSPTRMPRAGVLLLSHKKKTSRKQHTRPGLGAGEVGGDEDVNPKKCQKRRG